MRTFDNFPQHTTCPICKTNKDEECTLVGIDGTEKGNIEQAQAFHTKCIKNAVFRYSKDMNVLYTHTEPSTV